MRELSPARLRAVQLQALDRFVDTCTAIGVAYFLCAGTLLGAVRHGGFIPWDDDIDVMMPRPDYERLISALRAVAPSDVHVVEVAAAKAYPYPFAKFGLAGFFLVENGNPGVQLPVGIDVFPLDAYHDRMLVRAGQIAVDRLVRTALQILCSRKAATGFRRVLGEVLHGLVSPNRLARYADKRLAGARGSRLAGVRAWGYGEVIPQEAYGSGTSGLFEGRELALPANPATVLEGLYGPGYMQVPPVEERNSRHDFRAFSAD